LSKTEEATKVSPDEPAAAARMLLPPLSLPVLQLVLLKSRNGIFRSRCECRLLLYMGARKAACGRATICTAALYVLSYCDALRRS